MSFNLFKNILFIFPIFLFGYSQAEQLDDQSSNDQICIELSKPLPNKCPNTSPYQKEIKIIQESGLSKLMFYINSKKNKCFGSQRCITTARKLALILTDAEECTPDIEIKKVNQRFYLLFLKENYYLVDKYSDSAYLLKSGSCKEKGIVRIEKIADNFGYEKSLKDSWRFFFQFHRGNGRSANELLMTVFDIDCGNKKILGIYSGSICNDLDHDGRFELIVRDEVGWYLNWDWIFRWEHGCWIDSSRQFPNYFKTKVADQLKKLIGATYVPDQKLLKTLIKSAEKGGPCCL